MLLVDMGDQSRCYSPGPHPLLQPQAHPRFDLDDLGPCSLALIDESDTPAYAQWSLRTRSVPSKVTALLSLLALCGFALSTQPFGDNLG